MSLSTGDFTTINSKEGHQFVLETRLLPSKFNTNLPYAANIV